MTPADVHFQLVQAGLAIETAPYIACSTDYRMKFEQALGKAGVDEEEEGPECCSGCEEKDRKIENLEADVKRLEGRNGEFVRALEAVRVSVQGLGLP